MDDDAGFVPTGAHRLTGRTDAVLCFDVEKILYDLVLERVESDDPEPATWFQVPGDFLQPPAERREFVIDFDAKCLEGLGGRVDALGPTLPWDRPADGLGEFAGGPNR
jgi:hypothetical protein